MDEATIEILKNTVTIDFTTIGAKSGRPSRIEIWGWWFEDRYVITGTPGPRHWMANIAGNPEVIVHVRSLDPQDRAIVRRVVHDGSLLDTRVMLRQVLNWSVEIGADEVTIEIRSISNLALRERISGP